MSRLMGQSRMGGLPATLATVRYLDERFPPLAVGLPLASAFVISYLALGAAAGELRLQVATLIGATSTVLLFLCLRLIDDIDDLPREGREAGLTEPQIGRRRRGLIAGLCVTVLTIAALNLTYPTALAVVILALLATGIASFVFKPALSPPENRELPTTGHPLRDAMLAVPFEGAPLGFMVYGYLVWAEATGEVVPASTVTFVIGISWTLYVYWKYSRHMTRPEWLPYGLGWGRARFVLVSVLVLAVAFQIALAVDGPLPLAFAAYAAVLGGVFALATLAVDPAPVAPWPRFRSLAGLLYPAGVYLGVVVGVLLGH